MTMNKLLCTLLIISLAAPCAAADDFDASALDRLPGMGEQPPALGFNIDGGSVFSNYKELRKNGQFFWGYEGLFQLETPGMPVLDYASVRWCSNLEFTDIEADLPYVGYTANCVYTPLGDAIAEADAAGAQLTMPSGLSADQFVATNSMSAVYVPQANHFEGIMHKNSDNLVARFWDDGRTAMSNVAWEVFDEGDPHPNAATTSLVAAARYRWIAAEDVARALNKNAADFTPEAFERIYAEVWALNPIHAQVLAAAEAEGAGGGGSAAPGSGAAESAKEEKSGDAAGSTEDEEPTVTSGSGRKLASLGGVGTALVGIFQ